MNADCLGTGGANARDPQPCTQEIRTVGEWGPWSYLSCLGWATTGTSCQNWEPQGEREFRGPWRVRQGLLGVRPKFLANSPCRPHFLLFSPQGLTGPIGPPGPAGANGEKVSPGSFSSLGLTSPTELLSISSQGIWEDFSPALINCHPPAHRGLQGMKGGGRVCPVEWSS